MYCKHAIDNIDTPKALELPPLVNWHMLPTAFAVKNINITSGVSLDSREALDFRIHCHLAIADTSLPYSHDG